MRILHAVELYTPSMGGAQEVVRQVSERLAAAGHDVTVATSALPKRSQRRIAGVEVVEFAVGGNDVRGIKGDVESYRRFVVEGDWDIVMTYAAQQWTTDALLPVLDRVQAPTVLAPCGFSGLQQSAYMQYYGRLRERLPQFDALIFHSDTYQDIAFARQAGAHGVTVIPNAADEREFGSPSVRGVFRSAYGVTDDTPLLLTVGGHTGLKGHAAAMAVLRSSREAHRGTLAIIGNTPTGQGCLPACRLRATATRLLGGKRRVVLVNPPRPQVLGAYTDADLFVFCSMVECSPLVLFEAMAAGLPFVSVDVGNATEIAEWSGGGLIAPSRRRKNGLVETDVPAMTTLVDDLLADPERRREMGAQGRRAWEERFSWDKIAVRYQALYEALTS